VKIRYIGGEAKNCEVGRLVRGQIYEIAKKSAIEFLKCSADWQNVEVADGNRPKREDGEFKKTEIKKGEKRMVREDGFQNKLRKEAKI